MGTNIGKAGHIAAYALTSYQAFCTVGRRTPLLARHAQQPPLPEEEEKMASPSISDVAFGRTAPGICVRDIHAAHDFYSRILGFRKVFENGNPVGFMALKKDHAESHLIRKPDHHASTANVLHMFVSDAAALYSICESEGVRIIKRLMDKEYGQRAFVFADPDGNRIDIGELFA